MRMCPENLICAARPVSPPEGEPLEDVIAVIAPLTNHHSFFVVEVRKPGRS